MDRKRRPFGFCDEKQYSNSRIEDGESYYPEARRQAQVRLAILEAYHEELLRANGTKLGKMQVQAVFLDLYRAGLILPEIFKKPRTICRATLLGWDKRYRDFGFVGLIPKWKWAQWHGATVVPLKIELPSQIKEIKLSGPPTRMANNEFLPKLSQNWEGPPLACPLHLAVFYCFGIPKDTSMKRRMKMLRGQVSHKGKPYLDSLNAFLIDSMEGVIFESHSQIIEFYSKKKYEWEPKTRIFIRALSG